MTESLKKEGDKAKFEKINFTKLKDHKVVGKKIEAAFTRIKNLPVTNVSWIDQKIPEMLWVILIRAKLEQIDFVHSFRYIIGECVKEGIIDITHSGLMQYDEASVRKIIRLLIKPFGDALRPLLYFEKLPLYTIWKEEIDSPPEEGGLEFLMYSVNKAYDHQSQEATDCRWARMLPYILSGRMTALDHLKEGLDEIKNYPDQGDMRKVRPSIRAMDLAMKTSDNGEWWRNFWNHCLTNTSCLVFSGETPIERIDPTNVEAVLDALSKIFEQSLTHEINAKRDAIIGMALYSIAILNELKDSTNDIKILGRLGLRTLTECLINLAYLSVNDNPDLWKTYRTYGNGEAKKVFLKLIDSIELPKFVSIETLHHLANEDIWQEFTDINLGDWSGTDLRKRAENAKVKDIYDRFYDWTSGYIHGNWGVVKDHVYVNCLNPLHKFHRIPQSTFKEQNSVMKDAILIVNKILDIVEKHYPSFKLRIEY